MRRKLDGKFHGVIVKNKDGSVVPQDEWMVFLAKDNALPATLQFYLEESARLGASQDQIAAIVGLIERVQSWRFHNAAKCKTPDVQEGELVL